MIVLNGQPSADGGVQEAAGGIFKRRNAFPFARPVHQHWLLRIHSAALPVPKIPGPETLEGQVHARHRQGVSVCR